MNRFFTIVTREWTGGDDLNRVERTVMAPSESAAKKKFARWWRANRLDRQPDIIRIYQAEIIGWTDITGLTPIRPRKKTKSKQQQS